MYTFCRPPASVMSRMSGSKINTNTNNNNNAKKSGVLPNKVYPRQTGSGRHVPRGHSGYGVETPLPTVRHPNPPPSYILPQYSRLSKSERGPAQLPGTPRERRRQVMGQSTERSGRQSPNTLSRSHSLDQIHRKHDTSLPQYHLGWNDPQKQGSTVVTSHSSTEDSVNKRTSRTSREREVTKPAHKDTEEGKPQVTRESRSRERDRTPSSVRRSQSLNRTSPIDSWKDKRHTAVPSSPRSNRHATTTSMKTYDQSPTSSGTLTGNRTSSERHGLPSESSSYNRRNVTTPSYSTPPVVTTASHSTAPVVTTSYSSPSAITTTPNTTPSTLYSTPSTVSKNKVIETGEFTFCIASVKANINCTAVTRIQV